MKIFCQNIHEYIDVTGGVTVADVFDIVKDRIPFTPICARVNNKTESLRFPIYSPKQIEFIDDRTPSGNRVYVRSLCMMLYKVVTEVFPEARLSIDHSVSKGYFCRLRDISSGKLMRIGSTECSLLLEGMKRLVQRDSEFIRRELLTKDVKEIFRSQKLDSKVTLLDSRHDLYTTFYTLEGISDSYYGPLAPSTGYINVFNIIADSDQEGFLLLGRDEANRDMPQQPVTQAKMFRAFKEYLEFNKVIRVSTVGELNMAVKNNQTPQLINVAEAMHDKLLGRISDEILRRRRDENGAHVVMIAGPSSSGKTTSTKRLAIQLMTNLMTPKMISLDDYFIDRHHTPRDENGEYDYESLFALDLERFNSDLRRLLDGEEINLPSYSFELGRRVDKHRPLKLDRQDVLLIEGIHGLNPELTRQLPAGEIFKIYVSALTSLKIDDHNWIPTTDNRLLRRIVRDNKYRHTSALGTIERWGSVRRGEEKWIFPYQENADATFNSSLLFELGVMKPYAEPLLREVPHDVAAYSEAYRLLKFLSYFESIPADQIPSTSLLREFLGGSSFHY